MADKSVPVHSAGTEVCEEEARDLLVRTAQVADIIVVKAGPLERLLQKHHVAPELAQHERVRTRDPLARLLCTPARQGLTLVIIVRVYPSGGTRETPTDDHLLDDRHGPVEVWRRGPVGRDTRAGPADGRIIDEQGRRGRNAGEER